MDLFFFQLAQHEVLAPSDGHPVVTGMRNRTLRTNIHAGGAKDAATQIKRDWFANLARNGLGRTYRYAGVAPLRAFCGIHPERPTVTIRQGGGWAIGVGHRFAAALQTVSNGINDEHGFVAALKIKNPKRTV